MTEAFIAVSPSHRLDPALAVSACKAGALGILDLGYAQELETREKAIRGLARHAARGPGRWGLRWDMPLNPGLDPRKLLGDASEAVPVLILSALDYREEALGPLIEGFRGVAGEVFLEVHSGPEALAAQSAGCDGLILKGNEAGGRVGSESSFILLQRVRGLLTRPHWIQGGIGPETATAALVAGATGVVLGEQLWLTAEAPLSEEDRVTVSRLDGSETTLLRGGGHEFRVFNSPAHLPLLQEYERSDPKLERSWDRLAGILTIGNGPMSVFPLGQEVAFAKGLADRHVTVGGVITAFRRRIAENLAHAAQANSLAPGSPMALDHGTRYPVLQGPMTRVSDVTPFCAAVAEGGGLPFLSLSLMRGPEVRTLLNETRERLGDQPWGVGILGFVPPELREEQIAEVCLTRPGFAIIAGGRPSQAHRLEELGIHTYLHVPSPGLLRTFFEAGSRRFILEGRECGGHVGPRSSFTLWQSVVDLLLEDTKRNLSEVSIVFAGGIHDAVSASMVAALASPLVERGARIGVLMGTAYLFTKEAVSSGALTDEFQLQALACRRTRLLESGIGHATRCADTPFADEFEATRRGLLEKGVATEAIRTELELLNVGRLRLASKGVVRRSTSSLDEKGELVAADLAEQRKAGLYMIGDVALLREETTTMAELHEDVSLRPEVLLRETIARGLPWPSKVKRGSYVEEDIAIIGMAGLLPKAEDVPGFWRNIVEGVNAIVEIPKDRWDSEMYYDPDRMARDRVYSRWGGFIGPIRFNPMRWGIPPKSLDSIEPAQLYALEVASRCLKDAGYEKRDFDRERAGVLAAVAGPHELFIKYSYRTMSPQILAGIDAFSQDQREEIVGILEEALPEWTEDSFPGFLPNVLSGRIANRLNLCGPNFTVDAACGGSFAALQTAVNQLRLGEVDMMLVGAVDLSNNPLGYMSFSKTQALSPGGQSRPYEDSSDGIGLGEAVLTVILKRRSDAERDGDHIYAVIKGVGSSSDGGGRSLTAPAAAGQALALRRAYEDAGFSPSTVRLIEGHGTGTSLGDRTEVDALIQVFGGAGTPPRSVALGSVKSMIGHTKTAAGLAGLIKSALALGHKVLPPTLGVDTPNRSVDFLNGPFYLNTESRPWFAEEGHPRRAGISAFGFGGTNFHVVLEEYPDGLHGGHDPDMHPSPVELFVWHAGSREEMRGKLQDLLDALGGDSRGNLRELAHAVWKEESRRGVAEEGDTPGGPGSRLAILAGSIPELRDRIARALTHLEGDREFVQDPVGVYVSQGQAISLRQVGFLYPGQGSQKLQMLRDLVVAFPWSQDWFSTANHLARKELGGTLTDFIFPPPALGILNPDELARALDDTRVAQPALEAVGVFATELLARFGIRPGATSGHSFGEYVALWAAGCIESSDLTELAAFRGRISAEAAEATPGAMAAVRADPDVTREAMASHGIDGHIANINGPKQTVVAGTVETIERLLEAFKAKGPPSRRLAVTAPFHSPLVRTAAEALAKRLSDTPISAPALPVYSNVLGEAYPPDPMEIRSLLQRQLLEPVLFDQQIRRMYEEGVRLFVEVGPGTTLTSLVGRILDGRPHHRVSLDSSDRPGLTQLAHLLGLTAALGCSVDLSEWFGRRPPSCSSVDQWLAKHHRESAPGPMDWVVDPSGARPEKAETGPASYDSAPRDDKITLQRRGEGAPIRRGRKEEPQGSAINSRRATKLSDQGPRNSGGSSSGLTGTVRADLLRRHQETMAQWLELQRQQQATFDRALRIQEGLLFGEGLPGTEGDGGSRLPSASTPPRGEEDPRPIGERAGFVQPSRPPVAVPLPTDHLRSSSPAPSNSKASRTAAELKASVHEPEAVPPASAQDRVAPAGDSNGVPTTEEFRRDLLQAVFDRTGYPVDMLQEDLPLESGLGIDSIKTVEIFSTLKAYHPFFRLPDQEEEEQLAEFAQLKTLGDIIQAYDERAAVWTEREDVSGNGGSPAAGGAPSEDLSSPDREAAPPQRMVLEAARSATSASQKKKRSLTS